jgi:hypothetical protein
MILEVEGWVCWNSKYIDGHGNHRLKEDNVLLKCLIVLVRM